MRSFSVFLALVALGAAPLWAQTPGDIEKWRNDLLQPGPEARLQREAAIEALLTRKEPAAHAVLHEVLARGDDPDGVGRAILEQLRRKLGNPGDPIFGATDRERATVRSYLPVLARVFDPRLEVARTALHEPARDCLMAMTTLDRKRGFEELLKSEDPSVRTTAMLAAARCRDLGLAPLIAAQLEVSEHAGTAREALRILTFADAFASKAAFEEWWAAHSMRTYVQLAEEAARRARDAQAEAQRRADQRLSDLLADVVEAWVTRDDIPWAKIADRVLADDPRGSQTVCLARLRDALAQKPRTGGSAADRQAFWLRLQQQAKSASEPARQALVLEVSAYLLLATDDKQRAEMVGDLVAALRADSAVVRRAALAGLARFPAAANVVHVVDAAARARAAGETEVLAAALAALGGADWRAPAEPTLTPWLGLLRDVLGDAKSSDAIREAALSVLEKRTAEDKLLPAAFDLAAQLVADVGQPPVVRERAMLMLVPYAQVDAALADRYLQAMVARLTDGERRIRLKASQLLQSLPKHQERLADWRLQLFQGVGARLVEETDDGVLRALVQCLERQIDAEHPDRGPVIIRFCNALDDMAKANVNGARRALLVTSLAGQAATQGLETVQWVRAAQTLALLGERRELRNVIERQRPLSLLEREGVDPEALRNAFEIMVRTAQLKPPSERWQDLPREAEDTLAAIDQIAKLSRAPLDPAVYVLRIELLGGLGRHVEVLAAGASDAGDVPLTVADRARIAMRMVRSNLALDRVDDAVGLVEAGIQGAEAADLLLLREEVAAGLQRKGDLQTALAWIVDVLGKTGERDAAYPRRFLRRVEIEYQANPDLRLTSLQRLQEKEALFTGADVSADLRKQYEDLKRLISDAKG